MAVLVTGGSGYIGSALVAQLLSDTDDTVHTTVRNLSAPKKTQALQELSDKYPGRLHLYEADLVREGSFAKAMEGCEVVYHVASPFFLPEQLKGKSAESALIEPALSGTRNVLETVNKTPSVKRVVLTSTIGAVFGDYIDVMDMKDKTMTEEYFNTSSSATHQPYHYSKVLAEKEAWKICGEQSRWDMVAILPGLVLGPSITLASDSGSLHLVEEMIKGYFCILAADLSFCTVDVREVATAHIKAAKIPSAKGRYILCDKQMYSMLDFANALRPVHKHPILLPRRQAPNWLVRVAAPLFGLDRDFVRRHFGIRFGIDNHRSIEELGITYRPLSETLADHYRSWLKNRS